MDEFIHRLTEDPLQNVPRFMANHMVFIFFISQLREVSCSDAFAVCYLTWTHDAMSRHRFSETQRRLISEFRCIACVYAVKVIDVGAMQLLKDLLHEFLLSIALLFLQGIGLGLFEAGDINPNSPRTLAIKFFVMWRLHLACPGAIRLLWVTWILYQTQVYLWKFEPKAREDWHLWCFYASNLTYAALAYFKFFEESLYSSAALIVWSFALVVAWLMWRDELQQENQSALPPNNDENQPQDVRFGDVEPEIYVGVEF